MTTYGEAQWDAARLLFQVAHRLEHHYDRHELAEVVGRWSDTVAVEAVELLGLQVLPWLVIDICDALADVCEDDGLPY